MINSVQQKCNDKYDFTNGIQFSRLKTIEIVPITFGQQMDSYGHMESTLQTMFLNLISPIHFEIFYTNLLLQSFCHMISNVLKIQTQQIGNSIFL